MIQGVRHRFREKRRSKSPDCLDSTDQPETFRFPENGRSSLPRAASMLSTDYGFNPEDWGGHQSQNQSQRNSARLSSISAGGVLSDCDLTRPGPLPAQTRAASVNAVNQAGLSHGTSIQRGKSVRFGENRISVFLQDSTQALEECVRLALSYAEESKRGEYCSDSEAVTLSRSLTQTQSPDCTNQSATEGKPGHFWSDSEGRRDVRTKSEVKQNSGDYYSNFSGTEGPPTPTNYKPKSFSQAVNSLDRVERLDKRGSHLDKTRKKRSTQINEIFSFIDKILSGCDSGCNDEFCPFVREAAGAGADWRSGERSYNTGTRLNISSLSPPQYQQRKQFSLPGGSTSQSYAYRGKLPTEGQLHHSEFSSRLLKMTGGGGGGGGSGTMTGSVAGYMSDSDCDTSESSTLVERGRAGRPPRSRLRPHQGWSGAGAGGKRTTEDVFAQIIICCESNKESLGMPKYGHIHQKISQTVCNAIFLCKVIIHLR